MDYYERYDEGGPVEGRCCENLRAELEREIARLKAELAEVSQSADKLLEQMQDERDKALRDVAALLMRFERVC